MASEWCTPTGSSTICPIKCSPSEPWSSSCHRAQRLRKEVFISCPPLQSFWALPTLSTPLPVSVRKPFLPSGSRGPSLEAKCGTSSSHACPKALLQEQNTQVGGGHPTQTHPGPLSSPLIPAPVPPPRQPPDARKHTEAYTHKSHKPHSHKQAHTHVTHRQSHMETKTD